MICFKDPAKFPVGPVKMILARETVETFHGCGCRDMATFEGYIEMSYAVPLVNDPIHMNGAVGPSNQRRQGLIVLFRINFVNPLFIKPPDPRGKVPAQHCNGRKVVST